MNTLIHQNAPPHEMPAEQVTPSTMARLARFAERDLPGLTELLAACHSAAASDRARDLAKICRDAATDPAALRTSIGAVLDDLQSLPTEVEIAASERLRTQAAETLDAAVRYHGGRLESLARELDMSVG